MEWTALHAPELGRFESSVLLPGAGSERCYWRLRRGDGSTELLMCYGREREENAGFAPLTRWLAAQGLRVPALRAEFDETDGGWLWLEDFGETDLRAATLRRPAQANGWFGTVAEEVARWHRLDLADLPDAARAHLQRGFDIELYQWEQDYFWDQGVARLGGLSSAQIAALRAHPSFAGLARELAALPRVPVHRDFQSTNVMLTADGGIGIIDYQGMREGLGEYDLASLIYDPYLPFDPQREAAVLQRYAAATGREPGELGRRVRQVAVQRLMQALGAYGKLGLGDGKQRFLQFVEPARQRLAAVVAGTELEEPLSLALESME